MQSILVTGATSFIGMNLIPLLLQAGHRVYATVRMKSPRVALLPKNDNLQIIPAAMADFSHISAAIDEQIEVIFHLAWQGAHGKERDNKTLQIANMNYSLELLNSCDKLNCRSFIDAGSQAEYGHHDNEITEDSELRPLNAYGKYKLRTFQESATFCRENNISYHHPRIFSLYGAGDYEGNLLPTLIRTLLSGQDMPLTTATQHWDFLHISDAVHALLHLAFSACADGVYNLASGDCRRLNLFIKEVATIIGSKSKLNFGTVPTPTAGLVSIQPVVNKIIASGWRPEVPFNEGIRQMISEVENK